MRNTGNGDRLARGAISVSYLANENNNISQSTWDKAFADFDPEAFAKKEPVSRVKVEGAVKETSRSKR